VASIWAAAGEAVAPVSVAAPASGRANPYEEAAKRMPDALRRFVVAYAGRLHQLPEPRRRQLAEQVAGPLGELLPVEVAAFGPLAILDGLAGLMYTPRVVASPLPPPSSQLPPSAQRPPASRLPPPSV
jgi:hypothetical protein